MVRPAKVGRSRGCQPCRQRRIKCDLAEPSCKRCIESGRSCPGPLTGLLFINSEPTETGKIRGKLARQHKAPPQSTPSETTALSDLTYSTIVSSAPSIIPIHEKGILLRFLEFFPRNASRSSWMLKLPELQNNPDAHALRASLRAVSLAYAAHVTQDSSIRYESYRHYGWCLQRQRTTLMETPMTTDMPAASNVLLAMVMLSYFELISGISPMAWLEHTAASEKLLVMLGRDALKHEIIGQLFYSIRSHSVHRAAIYGQYSAFSEQEWLEANLPTPAPKRSVSRSFYDKLVEFILLISRYTHGHEKFPTGVDAETMLKELEEQYQKFMASRNMEIEETPLLKLISTSTSMPSTVTEVAKLHSCRRMEFPAMAAAYFHTAAILLVSYMSLTMECRYDLNHNANAIVAAGTFLSRPGGGNGVAVLRMMLPFSSIWCFVGDEKIKWDARKVFEQWSIAEGMSGLCGIGFPQQAPLVSNEKVEDNGPSEKV